MNLWCAHCHRETHIAEYNLFGVGTRWLCDPCFHALQGMGAAVERIEPVEPERRSWFRELFRRRVA